MAATGRSDPYASAAAYYARGRMPYPPAIVAALGDVLHGRLLDVGCGPGSLTHLLAPHVVDAVGVDASEAMLAEARRDATPNETFVCARAEALPADLGTFDVITLAQSFHWMEQQQVAAALHGMLVPGGALVHVGATTHEGDGDVPRAEVDALIRSYLGDRPPTRADERRNLAAAGFDGPIEIDVARDDVYERSEDDVVASVFSLSYASPAMFGNRRDAFERDLRALLGGRTFRERPRDVTLLLYRV